MSSSGPATAPGAAPTGAAPVVDPDLTPGSNDVAPVAAAASTQTTTPTGGSKTRKGNKALSDWVTFVKQVQKEENLSYSEAMQRASKRKAEWKRGGNNNAEKNTSTGGKKNTKKRRTAKNKNGNKKRR